MNCGICSSPTRRVFDLRSQRHDVTVPVMRCKACDAYSSDGGPVNYDDVDLTGYYTASAPTIKARYERIFDEVGRLAAPGRFLDIGAGMGFSLEVAGKFGWSSHGLEPNRALVQHAVQRGLAVEQGYLDDARKGQYEFILVDNVLEHVPDPAGFLRNARRLLAPSALLLVAIPPMDWLRKALAAVPYVRNQVMRPQLDLFSEVDEHLNVLCRHAMGKLAHSVGLEVLPACFHHSRVFDNAAFRTVGLDDGNYFMKTREEPR